MIRKGYRYLLTAVAAASAAALLTFAARNDFGLGRNMEITVNMMRELSLNYVDPVDPDNLMERGRRRHGPRPRSVHRIHP